MANARKIGDNNKVIASKLPAEGPPEVCATNKSI